jgi:lipopolysaccharide transport system permease protein
VTITSLERMSLRKLEVFVMHNFSGSPKEMLASAFRNRSLIKSLAQREILGRYRGSMLGMFWSFVNPIVMLLVYTFVFSVIFKAKWSTGSDSKTEFALVLFAGLMVFNLFAECINRSSTLINSNTNFVKKIIFPLEILPLTIMAPALFHFGISLLVWLIAYLILFGIPHATAILLPLVLIPFMLLTLALTWILASLGVFLRDLSQFLGIIVTVLMFMSPIFYPITSIPEDYRIYLMINPITPAVEMVRSVLYFGELPNPFVYISYLIFSFAFACIGFFWFQKTRKGFADVL